MSDKKLAVKAVGQAAKKAERAARQSQGDRAKNGRKPSARTRKLQRYANALTKLHTALRRLK